jgi:hypothetical protein
VEHLLVESVALEMIRLRRARRLEAEYITGELNPQTTENNLFGLLNEFEPTILDPGLPAAIGFEIGQRLVNVFQRYESTFVTRMLRLLHELERIQRMRSGERLPAPAVMDVSVHASTSSLPEDLESAETGTVTHGFAATEHSTSHSVDVEVQADAGTVDSASAQFERPTELSGYKE